MNEIPLIVPTLKRFDLFTNMIESVNYPIVPYIINNSRRGYSVAHSWNEGMRLAMLDGYKYAIISNDDIEFMHSTIYRLVEGIKNSDAVTISPNSYLMGRDADFFYPREGYISGAEYACFIVNMEKMVDLAGWFDENFFPAYFEDNDMNYRIKLAGGTELIDTEIGIKHHGSATGVDTVDSVRWNGLKAYYVSKWGGEPRHEIWTSPYNDDSKSLKYWQGNDE